MIRYAISPAKLRAAITKVAKNWFDDAADVLVGLPNPPKTSDFKPLWSKIKGVYIELQNSKCCFCEKPLEGNIEQDVEHFRPKAGVKSWTVPPRLSAEGVTVQQPADGSSEPGYARLAYSPFNYAMACKICNSTLKKNYFPIEGTREPKATDPAQMDGEKALLIYPIGSTDTNPEDLIEFEALSPIPKLRSEFGRRRALVTIELFQLDDTVGRRSLFKRRAELVRLLFSQLEGRSTATTAAKRHGYQTWIDWLTSPESAFTNCLRSFKRLYDTDPVRAEKIAELCLKFTKKKRTRRRGTQAK